MFRVILDGADHLSGLLEIFCDTDKNLKRKLLNSTVRGSHGFGMLWGYFGGMTTKMDGSRGYREQYPHP